MFTVSFAQDGTRFIDAGLQLAEARFRHPEFLALVNEKLRLVREQLPQLRLLLHQLGHLGHMACEERAQGLEGVRVREAKKSYTLFRLVM